MLTLYFAPGSSSMAPHIALHEVGATSRGARCPWARREYRDPAYLAINPEGKVPTLLVEGRPLTEVAGILFYLARRFPEARLLPDDDPEAEAQVVSWMSFLAATVHPARRQGVEHARAIGCSPNGGSVAGSGRSAVACRLPTSTFPALLAVPQLGRTRAERSPWPVGPPRPHDGPSGGAEDDRDEAAIGYELQRSLAPQPSQAREKPCAGRRRRSGLGCTATAASGHSVLPC